MRRHQYRVTASAYRPSHRQLPASLRIRRPRTSDLAALADLMLDAYRGTIDYDGETLEQAVEEVEGYLAGEAALEWSALAVAGDTVASTVLMSKVNGGPFVSYVMTRADAKNRGIASVLLDQAVELAWHAGHEEIQAWITAGNAPSERIFTRAGFEIVDSIDV
jgi:GNAT superfamily N-acetyltransferase